LTTTLSHACLPSGERERQHFALSLWRYAVEEIELLKHNPDEFIKTHGRSYGF
jgi:hypothetical protein